MGIFSKIKDVFKKVVRKVGKIIKKVTKPITKIMSKVLAPFNKLFGKLGWVGTLALGIMFPGFGAFGEWLGGLGGKFASWVTNAMPKMGKFFDFISTNIVKPFKTTFNSITETFRHGINKVGQAFGFADPGKLTWTKGTGLVGGDVAGTLTSSFDKWVADTGDKIFGRTTDVPLDSDIRHDLIDQETGFVTTGSSVGPPGTAEFSTTPIGAGPLVGPPPPSPGLPSNLLDPSGSFVGPQQGLAQASVSEIGFKPSIEIFPPEDGPNLFERFNAATETFRKRPSVRAGETLLAGYGAYSAFAGGDYDPEFYNPNVNVANQMLTVSEQPQYLEQLAFSDIPLQQTDTFSTLAGKYISASGNSLPEAQADYFTYAQNMPNQYGYPLGNFLKDVVTTLNPIDFRDNTDYGYG